MRARAFFSLCLVGTVGIASAVPAAAESQPVTKVPAIAVDGATGDWSTVAVQKSETEPKVTAVAQDGAFLYATFSTADLDAARRVLRSGTILWVNVRGAHSEAYGLRFRGTEEVQKAVNEAFRSQQAAEQAQAEAAPATGAQAAAAPSGSAQAAAGQDGQRRRRNAQDGTQRAPLGTLEVLKDGAVIELLNDGARDGGPAAACSFADGVAVYEFRVPLAEIGIPADSERSIAVGFQIGGRTQAERDAAASRQATGRNGAGGQRRTTPSPWGETTPGSSGSAAPAAGAGSADAPAQEAPAEGRRRTTYATLWHDVAVTVPPAPAAK
jgi:hypothetical protein